MMDVTASTFSAQNSAPDRTKNTGTSNKAAENAAQDRTKTEEKSNTLDYTAFLQLLIAQFKNQDPTAPMDPTEHVSQLASFSAVEQQVRANSKLDSLLTAFALQQADSVIGRTVTSPDGATSGKVQSVRIIDGGAVAILENGSEVQLGAGVTIA
jgi:flagellar basal-body rod modification protein FlgD